jgi:hypothetical protein
MFQVGQVDNESEAEDSIRELHEDKELEHIVYCTSGECLYSALRSGAKFELSQSDST